MSVGMSPPPAQAGPRRWVVVVVVAWVLILAGSGTWAILRGGVTDREETTVAQAQPVVDRAAADLVTAAASDGRAVAAISDLLLVGPCRVSVLRPGARYQRVVTAIAAAGTEAALLRRVADRLPASYGASVTGGSLPRLVADAGLFVGVSGAPVGSGVVRFVIDTGNCRTSGGVVTPAPASPDAEVRAPVDALVVALRLTGGPLATYQVACPGGGRLTTVTAHAVGGPGPLDAALAGQLGVTPIVATPEVYAYRTGALQVSVRGAPDGVDITATRPCLGP